MSTFLLLKYVHILAAIAAVGSNMSYALWLFLGKEESSHQLFALRGIKKLDTWVANPAYLLSLMTGLGMVHHSDMPLWEILWLRWSLILFAIMGIGGFAFYSPVLTKQVQLLERGEEGTEAYLAMEIKQRWMGVFLSFMALAIVFLMVVKPV
jgi:uncharacterized membrane protein